MPNSYQDFNNASETTTSVTFNTGQLEYLDTAHLKVVVTNLQNESTDFLQTSNGQDNLTPPFSVTVSGSDTTINFDNMNGVTGDGLPANTDKVRVQRVTPSASLLTTFQNASLLRADDLNDNAKQLLFVLQEQVDIGIGSLPLTASGVYDANNRKISNLADGTAEQDAATFSQLSALASYSTDAPTTPQFATFSGSDGTFDGTDTTFTIPFTPLSEIDATFICEVGGVVQVPGEDFRVSGNILTIVNRDVTSAGDGIDKIVIQAFGVTKSVFNFPVTGQASTNTEIPLTLKGAEGGDADWVLAFRKANNEVKGAITANGVAKLRKIEKLTTEGLIVDAKNITSSDNITSNGNLNVGSSASITQTGDATFNNLTISSGTQNADQAVPKSYVDSFGGFEGTAISPTTSLNSILTPGLYTGTVPANPESYFYPGNTSPGEQFALRVVRTGGTNGAHRFQEFISSSDNRITVRRYDGSSFGGWRQTAHTGDSVSSFALPNADFPMNNKRIINLADNTAAQDAVTQNHLQTNYKNNTELLDFIGKNFGPLQVRAYAEPSTTGNQNIDDNRGGFVRLSGTLNQQVDTVGAPANNDNYNGVDPYNISSGITIVNVTSLSSDPETWANSNSNTAGNNNTDAPYLIKITPGLGPLKLQVKSNVTAVNTNFINYDLKLNMYTDQDAETAHKTTLIHGNDITSQVVTMDAFLPNLSQTRFFGLQFLANADNHSWGQADLYVEISRATGNIADVANNASLTQITP